MSKKYKRIKVTFEEEYIVEMYDDETTRINGWTIDEVVNDWFINRGFIPHHATRVSHEIYGSKKYIFHEVTDFGVT